MTIFLCHFQTKITLISFGTCISPNRNRLQNIFTICKLLTKKSSHETIAMPSQANQIKTVIALLLAILTWSSSYVFIRVGLKGYSPGALALLRYLVSSTIMLMLYFRLPKRQKPTLKEAIYLFFSGFFGVGIYVVSLNYGMITVSASISSFIIGMSPIISLLWARMVMKESISQRRWLGIGISILGLLVILISKHRQNSLDWHIVFVLIATCCGGFYNVAQKPLMLKFHPIEVATIAACSATVAMFCFFPQLITELPKAPPHATGAAIYLAIASGCIGYGCWSYAMSSDIPANKLVPIIYTLPLFSTLIALAILGEMPTLFALIGGFIALIGAIIATK